MSFFDCRKNGGWCWMLDAGFWMLGAGCWMLNALSMYQSIIEITFTKRLV